MIKSLQRLLFSLALVILFLLITQFLSGKQMIHMEVNQESCIEPCEIVSTVHIDPHKDNKWAIVSYSDLNRVNGKSESWRTEITGQTEEFIYVTKRLPAGTYSTAVQLFRLNMTNRVAYDEKVFVVEKAVISTGQTE